MICREACDIGVVGRGMGSTFTALILSAFSRVAISDIHSAKLSLRPRQASGGTRDGALVCCERGHQQSGARTVLKTYPTARYRTVAPRVS